ncbi:MAG TPA: chitinase [Pedobacter sp.]
MRLTTFKTNILIVFITVLMVSGCKGAKKHGRVVSSLSFFSEKDFNRFFPKHDQFYTYAAFQKAIKEMSALHVEIEKRGEWIYKITRTDDLTGKSEVVRQDPDWDQDWAKKQPYTETDLDYGSFCAAKDMVLNKNEAAAFFAHTAHETRNGEDGQFDDGLMLKQELNTGDAYIIENTTYPAVKGQKYYGRGPLQLSYNGNYGFASTCIFGDKDILLKNPDRINEDAVLAFKTALYFWMTPQGKKPSAHDAVTGIWKPSAAELKSGYRPGFGMTINIINGALECNKGEVQPAMIDRIGFYRHFLDLFGLKEDKGSECSCGKMLPVAS